MKKQLPTFSFVFVWLCLAWLPPALAQDAQFSQYNRSPIQINPALTGTAEGKVRVLAAHRNQRSQVLRGNSFVSHFVSVDTRVLEDNKQSLGIGVSALRDASGESNIGSKSLNLSVAYMRMITGAKGAQHKLRAGIEGGIVDRNFDIWHVRTAAQFEVSPIFDGLFESNFRHTDINVGVAWQADFPNGNSFTVGIAAHHLNSPSVSLLDVDEVSMNIRYAVHGTAELGLSDKWSIVPTLLYWRQGGSHTINLGSSLRKSFGAVRSRRHIEFGILARWIDTVFTDAGLSNLALGPILNLYWDRFSVGMSADVVVQKLQTAGSFDQAFELSFGYLFGQLTEHPSQPILHK